ncbi:MAG TPA: hypothetical protein VNJ01_00400 [Bacteriovoracaceae bacterium]|nr:hypothetical protein [Bacteriovoracaceae bacterium]
MKFLVTVLAVTFNMSLALAVSHDEIGATTDSLKAESEINHSEFLGCVETRRDCEHEAEHHGYHHFRARRDHHQCDDHHEPFACYGIE